MTDPTLRAPRTLSLGHRCSAAAILAALSTTLVVSACGDGEDAEATPGTQGRGVGDALATPGGDVVPCQDPPQVAVETGADALAVEDTDTTYAVTGSTYKTLTLAAAAPPRAPASGLTTTGTKEAGPVGGGPVFTDEPNTCQEKAFVAFGPTPYGMPPVKWPEIRWCSDDECERVALGWLRTHHGAWRLAQMFEFMNDLGEAQRSYAWNQPGVNAEGEKGHPKSAPSYWFGGYESGRFAETLEAVRKYWKVVRQAKTGGIALHLQCPDFSMTTNPCISADAFGVTPLGTHWVKGYVNFCPEAFFTPGLDPTVIQNQVDGVAFHEPIHHLFVGGEALTDTKIHWHGNACAASPDSDACYFRGIDDSSHDDLLEHMREYSADNGKSCSHRNKLIKTVDSYAQFARAFGTLVLDGEIVNWPKWADPTPHPPECVGDIGCLCETVPSNESPDGDYSATKYCGDHEAEPTVCMKTTFNASETVGICTNCADTRGPGCACNDLTQPCDIGFCWGQDTGPGNVDGTCYRDPPPDWACLANCEMLLGNGAFCMNDHPDGARCVPYATTLPEATLCWEGGGFIDADSNCETNECGPLSEPVVTCQDLGYPGHFVCEQGAFRCVPNP